ncbi:MAG: S8 family serine peptidase [Bacteroidales bacterium]|jgi:tetratricopeptide (TPR) repeat protein|nr:S8 family serine peptidase [Bacteroidales bacterium]
MKKNIQILYLLLLPIFNLFGQNNISNLDGYYYASGKAHYWTTDSTSVNIIIKNMDNYHIIVNKLENIFNAEGDEILADDEDDNIIINSFRLPIITKDSLINAISIEHDDIVFFTYSKVVNENRIWLRNEVIVKYNSNTLTSIESLQNRLATYDSISISYVQDNELSIICKKDKDVIEIANLLYNTESVEYSTPDFYYNYTLDADDPLFNNYQWNLKNTGQTGGSFGIDIRAEGAWDFLNKVFGTIGTNIKIAVIDDGVEEHEDLYSSLGYSRVLNGYTANSDGTGRPRTNGYHGQNCAGIIAASHNTLCVAGIAPNTLIIPIRIVKNNGSFFSQNKIANAITKSWQELDAHILSNSWGDGNKNDNLNFAINNAIKNGRNGNGCIVVFSSGNKNKTIIPYPQNVNDSILVVGAIDKCGIRSGSLQSVPSSCDPWDGGNNAGSNYGTLLDIVAPGTTVPTIDRHGELGFTVNNHRIGFGGTSAACPHIAGVAALVLSANPNLTGQQVRDIIESTATKLPNYTFTNTSNRPNGTWNQQVGYGLVNAEAAVKKAYFLNATISGSTSIGSCNTATFYYNGSSSSSMQIVWSVGPALEIVSGQGTKNVTIISTASSSMSSYIKIEFKAQDKVLYSLQKQLNITGGNSYPNLSNTNFEITSNQVWNTESTLGVEVIIKDGVTLTINSTIHCGKNAKIIINPGAKLIIDGGKLTNSCSQFMWEGIRVIGNKNQAQTEQYQGTIILKNNAVIENANFAVTAHGVGSDGNTSGGIIQAKNTTFRNNRKSITFWEYTDSSSRIISSNKSFFKNCTFIVDDNNLFESSDKFFENHISLWGVYGIKFNGCNFVNNISNTNERKQAIYTEGAYFIVDESCINNMISSNCGCGINNSNSSTFTGFTNAIDTHTDGTTYTFKVNKSNFSKNEYSIKSNTINNFTATRLNINFDNNPFSNPVGIKIDQGVNYKIEANSFYAQTVNTSKNYIGIDVKSVSGNESSIYLNDFKKLNEGIYVRGGITSNNPYPERGLQFACNYFSNNSIDIHLSFGSLIQRVQGSDSKGSDNDFSENAIYNIQKDNTKQLIYKYGLDNYHYPTTNTNTFVTEVVSVINNCQSTLCSNTAVDKSNENYKKDIEIYSQLNEKYSSQLNIFYSKDYDKVIEYYDNGIILDETLLLAATDMHEELLEISWQMAKISNNALQTIKTDTIYDLNKLSEWYNVINTLNAKYSLAETYYQMGKYEDALKILETIPKIFYLNEQELYEHTNYINFFEFKNKLHKSGRNYFEMREDEIKELTEIAMLNTGVSSLMAQGILCFFHDICINLEEKPLEKSIFVIDNEQLIINNKNNNNDVYVYPNPGKDYIIVICEIENNNFELFNINGSKQISIKLQKGSNTINTSFLKQGVYIYKVIVEDKVISGKWVKQ